LKHEDGSLPRRQLVDELVERGPWCKWVLARREERKAVEETAPTSMEVEGGRGHDAHQPGIQRLPVAELPDPVAGAQVRVLEDVLGVIGADKCTGGREKPWLQLDEPLVEVIDGTCHRDRDRLAHCTPD
jgi:hypothetical protein